MEKINIIPFGSGSTGNSIYIEIGKYKILVDMGIGYRMINQSLLKYDRKIEDIDAIFLTHGHNDHTKAYKAICNHVNCNIYCDYSVMYPIRELDSEKRIVINMNEVMEILPELFVKAIPVPHDYVITCAYTFEYHDKKIGYLTDCGRMSNKILKEFEKADVMIIEANHDVEMLKNGPYPKQLQHRILSKYGHLSNEESAKAVSYLHDKGTNNFLLAHLSEKNNTPELARETVKNILHDEDVFIYTCKALSDDFLTF